MLHLLYLVSMLCSLVCLYRIHHLKFQYRSSCIFCFCTFFFFLAVIFDNDTGPCLYISCKHRKLKGKGCFFFSDVWKSTLFLLHNAFIFDTLFGWYFSKINRIWMDNDGITEMGNRYGRIKGVWIWFMDCICGLGIDNLNFISGLQKIWHIQNEQ